MPGKENLVAYVTIRPDAGSMYRIEIAPMSGEMVPTFPFLQPGNIYHDYRNRTHEAYLVEHSDVEHLGEGDEKSHFIWVFHAKKL